MAAYMIVDNEVTDPEGFREYQKRVGSTLESYGGTFLVRGGTYEILEGDWHLHRLILLEFPSVDQARRWYQSDEYAPVKDIRLKTALTQAILVQVISYVMIKAETLPPCGCLFRGDVLPHLPPCVARFARYPIR
jgi:uncharacterized protein (DUF1330 family)